MVELMKQNHSDSSSDFEDLGYDFQEEEDGDQDLDQHFVHLLTNDQGTESNLLTRSITSKMLSKSERSLLDSETKLSGYM